MKAAIILILMLVLANMALAQTEVGWETVTWDTATALSDPIMVGAQPKPIAVVIDSGFTGASITFQGLCPENATYYDMYEKDGTELIYVVDSTKINWIILLPVDFAGAERIKMRRGTASVPRTDGDVITTYIARRKY